MRVVSNIRLRSCRIFVNKCKIKPLSIWDFHLLKMVFGRIKTRDLRWVEFYYEKQKVVQSQIKTCSLTFICWLMANGFNRLFTQNEYSSKWKIYESLPIFQAFRPPLALFPVTLRRYEYRTPSCYFCYFAYFAFAHSSRVKVCLVSHVCCLLHIFFLTRNVFASRGLHLAGH